MRRLARFRRRYTSKPTAIERLERLSAHVGGPGIWIKRDDQAGLTGGGNKTGKLEFLVADALVQAPTLSLPRVRCSPTLAAAMRECAQGR